MLASDILIREKILKLYDDVIGTLRNLNPLPADLRDTLQEDELLERTREKRKAFSEDHCQVVVSGRLTRIKTKTLQTSKYKTFKQKHYKQTKTKH